MNLSDDQMKASIDMMKSNPEMFKSMMKAQGMNMGDSQMDMMLNMMSPEMFKMAQNMQKSGAFPQPNAGGNPGANNDQQFPNMNGPMDGEQMKQASSALLNNPEMIKMLMNTMTSDPDGPAMQMLRNQFPNANPRVLST